MLAWKSEEMQLCWWWLIILKLIPKIQWETHGNTVFGENENKILPSQAGPAKQPHDPPQLPTITGRRTEAGSSQTS